MATLDEVYRKFGEVSEAAHILESELSNLVLAHKLIDEGLLEHPNPNRGEEIYKQTHKKTLGQLIQSLRSFEDFNEDIEQLLSKALDSRNKLSHFFYMEHNFRRFSDDGRDVMLRDLEAIHEVLQETYMAVRPITVRFIRKLGTDPSEIPIPTGHVQL